MAEPPPPFAERVSRYVGQRVGRFVQDLKFMPIRLGPWVAQRRSLAGAPVLDEAALRATRRSDTAFIFGSGRSLHDLTPGQWDFIAARDSIGFNYFTRQRFVPVSYHLVGEIASSNDFDPSVWRPALAEYAELITQNPMYADTIIGLQEGYMATQSNRLAAARLLRPGTRVFRYRRLGRDRYEPPTTRLSQGLVHGPASVCECVNLAVVLGFTEIVVCGVDLYDTRYFWLPPDEDRQDMVAVHGLRREDAHPVAAKLVPFLGRWRSHLAERGVTLSVQNPRSLLASEMPVYRFPEAP